MGVSFTGIEYKVEELFWEIERRMNIKIKQSLSHPRYRNEKRGLKELKRLTSLVNYDG